MYLSPLLNDRLLKPKCFAILMPQMPNNLLLPVDDITVACLHPTFISYVNPRGPAHASGPLLWPGALGGPRPGICMEAALPVETAEDSSQTEQRWIQGLHFLAVYGVHLDCMKSCNKTYFVAFL